MLEFLKNPLDRFPVILHSFLGLAGRSKLSVVHGLSSIEGPVDNKPLSWAFYKIDKNNKKRYKSILDHYQKTIEMFKKICIYILLTWNLPSSQRILQVQFEIDLSELRPHGDKTDW